MPSLPNIWNIEWLNANSQRKYPLRDDATLKDTTGTVAIPNDLIVDMTWPINAGLNVDPTLFHIYGLIVFGTGVTIELGYNGSKIAEAVISLNTFVTNNQYLLQGIDPFSDSVGKIVVGSLTNTLKIPGRYLFTVAASGIQPRCVVPSIAGVTSIKLRNGSDVTEAIQGDIVFQAGTNFQLSYDLRTGTPSDPHIITFSAISGEGLNQDCSCIPTDNLPCIKTINGIGGDTNGNFNLTGSDCIEVTGISNGAKLADSCAKPCCGCNELNTLNQTLFQMVSQLNGLTSLASQLNAQINNLENNILQSRI